MIAVQCPECHGDTKWRYPTMQWAREHVGKIEPRWLRHVSDKRPYNDPMLLGMSDCPDAFGHMEKYQKGHP